MTDKYLIINFESQDVWPVEISPAQLKAMQWLTEQLNADVRFIKIDSETTFKWI